MLLVAKIDQGVQAVHGFHPDRAAIAAITTVRAAKFNEFFTPEAHTACPAAARADIDFGQVEKLHGWRVPWGVEAIAAGGSFRKGTAMVQRRLCLGQRLQNASRGTCGLQTSGIILAVSFSQSARVSATDRSSTCSVGRATGQRRRNPSVRNPSLVRTFPDRALPS